jgi:hypothetical protein
MARGRDASVTPRTFHTSQEVRRSPFPFPAARVPYITAPHIPNSTRDLMVVWRNEYDMSVTDIARLVGCKKTAAYSVLQPPAQRISLTRAADHMRSTTRIYAI